MNGGKGFLNSSTSATRKAEKSISPSVTGTKFAFLLKPRKGKKRSLPISTTSRKKQGPPLPFRSSIKREPVPKKAPTSGLWGPTRCFPFFPDPPEIPPRPPPPPPPPRGGRDKGRG